MLTDDIFAQMVAEEVKNKLTPSRRSELMQKENWDRWKRALGGLMNNINEQIDSLKIDAEADHSRYRAMGSDGKNLVEMAEAAYSQRLKKINRFRFHVENRLAQVDSMIQGKGLVEEASSNDVEFYRNAIEEHRKLLDQHDIEATAVDKALWAALERRWEFDQIKVDW